MEINTQDYLKKALLDTQERVRDCMIYAERIPDRKIKAFFTQCAEVEGRQAKQLREFLENIQ